MPEQEGGAPAAGPRGAPPTLSWDKVCFRAASGRWILGNVSGFAATGRLLAVMGPSGCGKTTLLKILARRFPRQPRGARLGGRVSHSELPVAYVPQDPKFFSHLTTRETLTLACALAGDPRAAESADSALQRAGLGECAEGRVGGDTTGHAVAGVSGGERRRLSIACETVAYGLAPVIADEPTSGLDSFHADRVVRLLKGMAQEGRIVVASLHAPRSASFDMVDDVLLMSEGGRVCYAGPRSGCASYFAALGHACPEHHNEAEFLIDLVSVDTSSEGAARESLARVRRLQAAWERRGGMDGRSGGSGEEAQRKAREPPHAAEPRARKGVLKQFRLLAGRAVRQVVRDAYVNGMRLGASVVLAVAFGSSYSGGGKKADRPEEHVRGRAALMMQVCITTSMMAMVKSLNGFPRERANVDMERSRGEHAGGYGVGPYFLSKLLVETPVDACYPLIFGAIVARMAGFRGGRKARGEFLAACALQGVSASALGLCLGALLPSADAALAVGPCVMSLHILSADSVGLFSPGPRPRWLVPVAKTSLVRHGFEGMLASELRGAPPADPAYPPGDALLDALGMPRDVVPRRAALRQTRLVAAHLAVAYAALKLADVGSGAWEPDPNFIAPARDPEVA